MKKRLRKKLHKGEYQELGFECEIKLVDKSEETIGGFIDQLISYVESQGLMVSDSGSDHWTLVFAKRGGGNVSDKDRQGLRAWLEEQEAIASCRVSETFDLHYPPERIPYPS